MLRTRLSGIVLAALLAVVLLVAPAMAAQFTMGHVFTAPHGLQHPELNNQLLEWDSSVTTNAPLVRYFDSTGYSGAIAVNPTRTSVFVVRSELNELSQYKGYLYRFGADGSRDKWAFGEGGLSQATLGANKLAFGPNHNLLTTSASGTGGIMEITQAGQYVRSISTGNKPIFGAVWIPGTNFIYAVDGEAGPARKSMYRIDGVNGGILQTYTVITNTSDISYISSDGSLAVHAYYNSGSSTARYNLNGTVLGATTASQGMWGSAMAYDPVQNHILTSAYDQNSVGHINPINMATIGSPTLASPYWSSGTGGYPDMAVVGEFSYIPEPTVTAMLAIGSALLLIPRGRRS